ncbi:MAG: limonene-1,2-epoxide hydrolase family protein [Mycobacteriaceae bacterium]
MSDPTTVVTAFLNALERFDMDEALSYAAEDITYQNVPLPPARGKRAFAKQMRGMAKYGSGFEGRIHNIAANGEVVLTERTDVLKVKRFEAAFWVCGTFEVRDGQIVLWRDYFDWTTLFTASIKGGARALAAVVSQRRRT